MYASTASLDGISSAEVEGKETMIPSSIGDQSVFVTVMLLLIVLLPLLLVVLRPLLLVLSFESSGLMGEIDWAFATFVAATARSVGDEAVMTW